MQRPSERFSVADRRQVTEAVVAAELQTSAEIVPVIAAASGRYDRAEDLVGLWTAIVALLLVATLWKVEFPEPDGWDEPSRFGQLLALAASVLIGFFAGAAAATRIDWLRRLFVSGAATRRNVGPGRASFSRPALEPYRGSVRSADLHFSLRAYRGNRRRRGSLEERWSNRARRALP